MTTARVATRGTRGRGLGALVGLVMALAAAVGAATGAGPADAADGGGGDPGTVVVANRGSSSLTLIDAGTDQATELALPAGGDPAHPNPAQPMYVVFAANTVFVGDRANDRVLAIDPHDWSVVGEVPTGAGVFHMWADPTGRQLWVNNDIDNTMTVIDPAALEVITTVDLPADLVAAGARPHDVILDRNSAYVTVVGLAGADDAVVRFDLDTFAEVARAPVGQDPHVTLDPGHGPLFVASQDASEVAVLDRDTLARLDEVAVPAAHGIDISANGRVVYTTNIAGGGTDAVWAVDAATGEVVGEPVDAPFPVPHNAVLTGTGRKLYVTHSGAAADRVSVYEIGGGDPTPTLVTTVEAGLNPFGLEFVPRG